MPKKIELNAKFQTALDLLEKSERNVFFDGASGNREVDLVGIISQTNQEENCGFGTDWGGGGVYEAVFVKKDRQL